MLKILISLFLIFSINFSFTNIKANEWLRIYSRAEWGANEQYRYVNWIGWKNIFIRRNINNNSWNKKWANFSGEKKDGIIAKNKVKADKKKLINSYLSTKFSKYITLAKYDKFDWENKLAWPISKTNFVKSITIHHTESEYKDSFIWMKNIYKYHSLSREWWDIWYHYIIWYNWEIFEGRAGWDYVVWAHDTWNNYSTVWVSIMWNYDKRKFSDKQYTALKKLVSFLTKKYWIDLNNKVAYHKECFWKYCKNWIKTNYFFPIVGHKDGKWTACPWKDIYHNIIPKLIKELQPETKWYKLISYKDSLQKKHLNKIEKFNYKNKVNKYNWRKIRYKFDNLSDWKQKIIIYKLELLLNKKNLDWKSEILYNKFLDEIRL